MFRPVLEVADIFRDHGAAWRRANAGHVSLDQMKMMSAIEPCRQGLSYTIQALNSGLGVTVSRHELKRWAARSFEFSTLHLEVIKFDGFKRGLR